MPVLPLEDERAPKRSWEWVVGIAVPLVCAGWIAYRLHPGLILRNSTANGGDMGAHVYWPWFLEHNWFTNFRLQGWSPDWYSGFPIGQYYFPFPALLTSGLDLILPYNVAFKLVTVLGPIAMPIGAYVFAEQLEFPWPASPLCAAATLFFEFSVRRHGSTDTWTIYGGNLASSLAGEYSFALALSLALFFVGALAFTFRTGRRPWVPAVLLACCVMSHIVVALFAGFLGLLVWVCYKPGRTWRIAIPVGVVALLLTATWSFPIVATVGYTSSMRYEKVTEYTNWLFGPGTTWKVFGAHIPLPTPVWMWLLVLAALLGGAYWLRRSTLIVVIWAVTFGLAFRYGPQDAAVWNTRFLPFYFLALAFLAALGVAEIARFLDYLARAVSTWVNAGALPGDEFDAVEERVDARLDDLLPVDAVPIAAAELHEPDVYGPDVPEPAEYEPELAWSPEPALTHRAAREQLRRQRFVSAVRFSVVVVIVSAVAIIAADDQGGATAKSWASWNYSGYEAKAAWPEYHDLMGRMDALGKQRGCGRALWEPSAGETDAINNYGTSLALELLPYWTKGCIGSQEGLYFEASATKDAHFLTVSELGDRPSNPVRGLVYGSTADFARGVDHARMLGVRYLMFWTSVSRELADSSPELTPVLDVRDHDRIDPKGWRIYEIRDWSLVSGLDTEPVVAKMHSGTRTSCLPNSGDLAAGQLDTRLNAWECATDALWMDPTLYDRPVVASGPKSWQRVDLKPRPLTKVANPASGTTGSTSSGGTLLRATGPPMLAPLSSTPVRRIEPVKVSRVRETVEKISFHVDEIGKPVVVRTSYFPNWEVHGADGPYRVSPNLMVVVPRAHDVTLEYGLTSADWLGRIGTLLGIMLVALMIWRWPTLPRAWTTGGTRYSSPDGFDSDDPDDEDWADDDWENVTDTVVNPAPDVASHGPPDDDQSGNGHGPPSEVPSALPPRMTSS